VRVIRYTLEGTLEFAIANERQKDIKALDLLMHEDKEMKDDMQHVDDMLELIAKHDPTKKKHNSRKKQKIR
jgi:hypothetical protein